MRRGRRRTHPADMGVIVVATDGSRAASAALEAAIEIAAQAGDEIAVVTVWQALQGDFGLVHPPAAPLETLLDTERRHAEATLDDAARRVRAAGLAVETRLLVGDPAIRICDYADEVDARLIAIGAHGHRQIVALLVGSVSAAVVKRSGRPVLVVPARAASAARAAALAR